MASVSLPVDGAWLSTDSTPIDNTPAPCNESGFTKSPTKPTSE
jgi:hypothetical protein